MDLGAFSVSLAVKDIHASKAFYEKLGFEFFGGDLSQNWVILKNGNTVSSTPTAIRSWSISTCNPSAGCPRAAPPRCPTALPRATERRGPAMLPNRDGSREPHPRAPSRSVGGEARSRAPASRSTGGRLSGAPSSVRVQGAAGGWAVAGGYTPERGCTPGTATGAALASATVRHPLRPHTPWHSHARMGQAPPPRQPEPRFRGHSPPTSHPHALCLQKVLVPSPRHWVAPPTPRAVGASTPPAAQPGGPRAAG